MQNRDRSAQALAKRVSQKGARHFTPLQNVKVNTYLLNPYYGYDIPEFVARGYYVDHPFTCKDCDKQEVWTATQQKWWYEIAKGGLSTTATRCRACRRRERDRKNAARRVHLEGLARKKKSPSRT